MRAAFVVHVDLPSADPAMLESTAAQILDELDNTGLIILEVRPWSRHAQSNPLAALQDAQATLGESMIRGGSSNFNPSSDGI